jgi:Lrp/AsnC family leucine-responsive transcriptional regulator
LELDEIDRKILRLLQENGRMTNAALAEATGLTQTPTLQRLRKLEQRGVITGYAAIVDARAIGRGTMAFVLVKQSEHRATSHKRFVQAVAGIPEIVECHHIAGEDDFMLKVVVRDIAAYERFLIDGLARIPGIDRVKTAFVLSTSKAGPALPVDEA